MIVVVAVLALIGLGGGLIALGAVISSWDIKQETEESS